MEYISHNALQVLQKRQDIHTGETCMTQSQESHTRHQTAEWCCIDNIVFIIFITDLLFIDMETFTAARWWRWCVSYWGRSFSYLCTPSRTPAANTHSNKSVMKTLIKAETLNTKWTLITFWIICVLTSFSSCSSLKITWQRLVRYQTANPPQSENRCYWDS